MCVVLAPLTVRMYMDTCMCLAEILEGCTHIYVLGMDTRPMLYAHQKHKELTLYRLAEAARFW